MAYLLFCLYFLLLLWAIPHLPICRKTGQPAAYLRVFFGIKIMAGIAYGYFYAQRGGGDTWLYHQYGLDEKALLLSDPAAFVTKLFQPGYESGYGDFFGNTNSWWNDVDGNVFGKLLAVCNLITGGNYYINSLLFNIFSFTGTVLLLRVWKHVASVKNPLATWMPFLIPSFIFWSSGIHKENLLVLALGLIVYAVYFGINEQKFTVLRIVAIVAGLLIVIVMRNYLLLPLGLGLSAFWLAKKTQQRLHPLLPFVVIFLVAGVLFFTMHQLVPALNPPQILINWQQAFSELRSPNRFAKLPLEPNAISFIAHAPQAFFNAAFRPMVWEAINAFSVFSAIESMLMVLVCATALPFAPKARWRSPLLLLCAIFSFTVLLIVGYTVMFPGAIVRYRSIVQPFLLMPFLWLLLKHSRLGAKLKHV